MKTNQRRAFTLVELLVVIGIIALLISILMPALRRAKEAGNRTVCMNNHRTIMQALHMYATDNRQVLPFCSWLGQFALPSWVVDATKPGQFHSEDGPGRNTVRSGTLFKYIKSPKVYHCPFDPEENWKQAAGPYHMLTSYSLNGAINGYGTPGMWTKMGQFKSDDVAMWEPDELELPGQPGFYFNDAANFPWESISLRHGGGKLNPRDPAARKSAGAVYSTFGGAVEWTTGAEFDKWGNESRRNRVRCAPGRNRDGVNS